MTLGHLPREWKIGVRAPNCDTNTMAIISCSAEFIVMVVVCYRVSERKHYCDTMLVSGIGTLQVLTTLAAFLHISTSTG